MKIVKQFSMKAAMTALLLTMYAGPVFANQDNATTENKLLKCCRAVTVAMRCDGDIINGFTGVGDSYAAANRSAIVICSQAGKEDCESFSCGVSTEQHLECIDLPFCQI